MDWRPCAGAANPPLRVEITDGNQGVAVAAGDILRVSATVTNLGKAAVCRVQVLTRSDDPVLDSHEQLIGRLEPGQWKTVPLNVRVSARHGHVAVPMKVFTALDGQPLAQEDQTVVTVTERPSPVFAWRTTLDDSGGAQPDGVLQPGEKATLTVEVRNDGAGLSQATEVRVRVLGTPRLHLQEGRVRLGQLAPGASAVARFAVVGADPKSPHAVDDWQPVTLELAVADETLAVERTEPVELPWARKPLQQAPANVRTALTKWQDPTQAVWVTPPRLDLPRLQWPPLTGDCALLVDGTAHFDSDTPVRRFVTASVGGVKQAYQSGYGRPDVPFHAALRLDSGLNAVTIQARAGAYRIAERQLLVHCTRATPAATSP